MRKNKLVSTIIDTCFNENLDFRAHIFNSLGLLGTALGFFFAGFGIYLGAGIGNVLGNLGASVFAIIVLWLANKKQNYKLYFLIDGYRCFYRDIPRHILFSRGLLQRYALLFRFCCCFYRTHVRG